jgi:ribosome-associated protein
MPSVRVLVTYFKEDNVLSLTKDAVQAAESAALMTGTRAATSETLLAEILTSLEADTAEDIVQIDLRGKSEMGDYMIICSGRSTRQVSAIAEKLTDKVKSEFGIFSKIEGKSGGDWVLIDTGDVIVHVFRPEVREFYQLEKMWQAPADAASAD